MYFCVCAYLSECGHSFFFNFSSPECVVRLSKYHQKWFADSYFFLFLSLFHSLKCKIYSQESVVWTSELWKICMVVFSWSLIRFSVTGNAVFVFLLLLCDAKASKPLEYIYKTEKITTYQSIFPSHIRICGRKKIAYKPHSCSAAFSLFLISAFSRYFFSPFILVILLKMHTEQLTFSKCKKNRIVIWEETDADAKCICIHMQICVCFIRCTQITVIIRWYPRVMVSCAMCFCCIDEFNLIGSALLTAARSKNSIYSYCNTQRSHSSFHIKFDANTNSTLIALFVYAAGERKKNELTNKSGFVMRVFFHFFRSSLDSMLNADSGWKKRVNCLIV